MQQRFEASFWCPELATYALALDGDKQPCKVRSSNAGLALFSGIAPPDHALQVAGTLMGSGLFSGWGIRLLHSCEKRYNPMSYHNGSIWPHDNGLIAMGLRRYERHQDCLALLKSLFEASLYSPLSRLPELYCGFDYDRSPVGPIRYPSACVAT